MLQLCLTPGCPDTESGFTSSCRPNMETGRHASYLAFPSCLKSLIPYEAKMLTLAWLSRKGKIPCQTGKMMFSHLLHGLNQHAVQQYRSRFVRSLVLWNLPRGQSSLPEARPRALATGKDCSSSGLGRSPNCSFSLGLKYVPLSFIMVEVSNCFLWVWSMGPYLVMLCSGYGRIPAGTFNGLAGT